LVKTGFMILDDSDPRKEGWEGKYIPGTYNNYLKIKELPYFKRAFTCYMEQESQEKGRLPAYPTWPYFYDMIDGAYCYEFAEPWRKE